MMDLDLMRESLSSLCLLSGQLCDKYPRECSGYLECLWARDSARQHHPHTEVQKRIANTKLR